MYFFNAELLLETMVRVYRDVNETAEYYTWNDPLIVSRLVSPDPLVGASRRVLLHR